MKKIAFIVFIIFFIMCISKDKEPPEVSIVHPSNGSVTYNDSLYIQIIATDNRGIESVELFINDSLFITLKKRPFEFYLITTDYPDSTLINLFAKAYDYSENIGYSDTIITTIMKNYRPIASKPFGNLPDEGIVNTPYIFKSFALDTDDDSVYIRFSFGDGDTSLWSNMVKCGDTIEVTHAFQDTGTYLIKSQAKDKRGKTSFFSEPFNFTVKQ